MVKINVAKDKIETVKQKIKTKGWTIDRNTSQLLPEANKYRFKKILEEQEINDCIEKIKITHLKKIKGIVIKEKIFTPESENKFRDYLEKLEQERKEYIDIDDLVNSQEIRIKRFTHRNLMYFLEGKEIEKDVFIVFCKVLGIPWRTIVPKDSIYYKDYSLLNYLKHFDHHQQVNLLTIELSKNHHQQKLFLANNKCQCSLTWMLRRLDAEISNFTKLKCRALSLLKSQYLSLVNNNIETFLNENLSITSLEKNNILLILTIERYEDITEINERLRLLIQNQPEQSKGKLVVLLIINQDNYLVSGDLQKYIVQLDTSLAYTKDDMAGLISKIAISMGKILNDSPHKAEQLISKAQGNSLVLLREIYQLFECDRDPTWEKLWTQYP
ncbi:hypothetical protein H6G33_35435 [Calothrix sp. FACHB-1219]|uniref:hypothetical protein n=1 Tax=unclassified Calothrix TaxID=2619626 RepID=UPI001682E60A|nr:MULTISPECIES: hypothetical protein [unclassified Calothrix]MBD2207626.1 hypothetical protein [Calothrix sp. FACHB-168]MBD2222227.1 hypothetical protein [Calothrix sp. FACHB-1219]